MLSCVAQVDVGQRLLPDAQRLAAELKIQLVAQEGDRGSRVLAQVIDPLTRDDHLDEEAHFGALSIPDAMEDPLQVGGALFFAANRQRRLHQRFFRQGAEEADGVEEVRLADSVGARNASERSEMDVHADEVLEPVDFEARQDRVTVSEARGLAATRSKS